LSRRAKNIIRSTCSSFEFQLAPKNFLKISINHFASICFDSHACTSSGLKQNGNFSSVGSKIITSFFLDSGILARASSKRSQCGSIIPSHFQARISLINKFAINLDFQTPVFPIT